MNHFIRLAEAAAMTARYRQHRNPILSATYQNLNILPICETFDRAAFDTLLAKEGCAYIRIYYGMSPDLKIHAIIAAADAEGQDILPQGFATDPEEDVIDRANRCPELCPPPSALNS